MTAQELLTKFWSDAWSEGLWAASWSKSVEGLTAAQAAWQPSSVPGVPGKRHSIWQIVLHIVFWRDVSLRRMKGEDYKPTPDELARGNFPNITDPSEAAWADARRKLADSHARIAAALEQHPESERLRYHLPHDAYHFAQINYLRAMLGLRPIE